MQRCSGTTNFISIHLMFLLIPERIQKYPQIIYFNTSHVSINRLWYLRSLRSSPISIHLMFLLILSRSHSFSFTDNNFNTSHVSINPMRTKPTRSRLHNFNTSHVSINLSLCGGVGYDFLISIHLMFLLILSPKFWSIHQIQNFNTSHVSINRALSPAGKKRCKKFQYISCFY